MIVFFTTFVSLNYKKAVASKLSLKLSKTLKTSAKYVHNLKLTRKTFDYFEKLG